MLRWNLGPLALVHGDALRDRRTHRHEADNGPDWLVTPGNGWLYGDSG